MKSENTLKVSIITSTYKVVSKEQKSFFYEMFRSIHEQDYPNIEHVIIDGGSEDGSVDFIKNIIRRYSKKQIVFISEKDRGINDATNKGYLKSSGDLITLMCDDDFYVRPDAISSMVKKIKEDNLDFVCADTWWLDKKTWDNNNKSFIYRHPFLINAMLLKRELISEPPYYLDEKYPLCADYDLFLRLLTNENIKGDEIKEVYTVLRPGGISQNSNYTYFNDTLHIYRKYFKSKIFNNAELLRLHFRISGPITYLKILLFCKNKKIIDSVKQLYTFRYIKRYFIRRLEFYFYLKFITNWWKIKPPKQYVDNKFSRRKSRIWIEKFYQDLY